MSLVARLLEFVGRGNEETETYQCIKCGGTFDRDHYECPDCGVQHVVVRTDDSGRNRSGQNNSGRDDAGRNV